MIERAFDRTINPERFYAAELHIKYYQQIKCISNLNVDTSKSLKQGFWQNAKLFLHFNKKNIVYCAPEDVEFI